ncbi:type II secretion system F family protein [Roseovarius aestuariivivens]|uniref:type II secretion system F family protein n=1 Tax=Roseovarius aestuariivivens TaxID=1888910 RepID=UPI00108192C3|nr:type II secretion system F family protein [Roseovarius aestuariivivens]
MRAYSYVAYTADGRRKTGTVVGETETDATHQLAEQGLYPSELRARARPRKSRLGDFGKGRLGTELQAVLTRQLAVLLAAGLPAETALKAVRAGGSPTLEKVAAAAQVALMDGAPLSEALDQSGAGFPRYVIASVRSGEISGDAAQVFAELADHLETRGTDRAQISSALVYPAFVAAVSLLVCGILMVNVAPEIVSLFEMSGRPLPDLTRIMLSISDWIGAHSLLLGGFFGGFLLLLGISARVRALRRIRDRIALRLPLVGRLMRQSSAVQYLRTLALVLASRQPAVNACESAAGVMDIDRFRREADAATEAVRGGETLSRSLAQLSPIPPVALQLIAAGEMSARLGRMVGRAALLLETSLSSERKRIAALLEPILMILVGGLVLVIVLSVLLPIFELQSVVAN